MWPKHSCRGRDSPRCTTSRKGSAAKQTALAAGEVDLTLQFSGPLLLHMDTGDLVVILAGVHVGCWELFGTERVRTIRDLKGKTIAISEVRSSHHVFLASVMAYVGLDPQKDITWVTHPPEEGDAALRRGADRCLHGLPTTNTGTPGEADRARGGQQQRGPALVPVLLLYGGREPRVRPEASRGHQAGGACALEGNRYWRPRAGAGCPVARGGRTT